MTGPNTPTTPEDFLGFGQPKNPISPNPGNPLAPRQPTTQPSTTTAADFMERPQTPGLVQRMAGTPVGKATLGLLTTAGKVLQPFAAPQQVLFGGIGWLQKMQLGDYEGAGKDFSRAWGAAGDYLTWGYTARDNSLRRMTGGILGGDGKDARDKNITGYQLMKSAGWADYVAKPVGLAADFLIDIPILGWLGKAAKLDTALDVTLGVERMAGVNMAHAFVKDANGAVDLAGLRKFAIRVAATPFSTAPIHDLATGLPAYYRDNAAKLAARVIEDGVKYKLPMTGKEYTLLGGRSTTVIGGRESAAYEGLGQTVAQTFISKYGGVRGLPRMEGPAIADLKTGKISGTGIGQDLERFIYTAQSEAGSIALRAAQAQSRYSDLLGGMTKAAQEDFHKIAYRILDWDDPSDFSRGLADLDHFGQQLGRPDFKQKALDTLWESTALDTYMGFLRFKQGTMTAESVSGNYQGLRRFERAAFGQPKTDNPLASRFAQDVMDARQAGLKAITPDPSLHFRRSYNLLYQPQDIIDQVSAQALPAVMHQVDEGRLGRVMYDMLYERAQAATPNVPLSAVARLARQTQAAQMANDFATMFKGRNVDERTALSDIIHRYGMGQQEVDDALKRIGDEWWQVGGIAYRPPSAEVVGILKKMVDNPALVATGAGTTGSPLGTNRAVLKARGDHPDWLLEAMGQIHDISKLLDETKSIGTKQYVNRGITQMTYDFLKREDAIMTIDEIRNLPGGGHNNWRRVTTDLASKLKAMGDSNGGAWGDLPFKGDEYIPAAYHDLLVSATKIDDPSVLNTTFAFLMQAWKGHKIGNVASIVRDTLTNYRFAMDFGIRPDQLTAAVHAGITLNLRATEGGIAAKLRGARPNILDDKASITYRGTTITMKELTEVGGLFHGSFFVNELREPYKALRENLASSRGSGVQGAAAAIMDYSDAIRAKLHDASVSGNRATELGAKAATVAGKGVAGAVDLATGLGGPVTKMLQDVKGNVDVIYKLGVYIHKRSEGLQPMEAARYADELLFNYQNQPAMVDYLRRNGISPFAAFQFMSAGRFIRTMYENPYAVQRWYRLPQSATEGDDRTRGETQYTAPEYMRKQLWIPLFNPFDKSANGKAVRDSENRSMFLNLSSIMPESSIFNLTGTDAISQWIPPHVELAQQIMTGQGYAGMPIYDGGKSLAETASSGNRNAVAKGIVKALHQFGASPWSPGSPQADRLTRAIMDAAVPADQIMDNPEVQAFMKFQTQGVFAMGLQNTPIVPQRTGSAAPLDPGYAIGRYFGATTSPVTGFAGKPGSAAGTLQGLKRDVENLKAQMKNDIKNAGADPRAVKAAWAKYAPLIAEKQMKIANARTFVEKYGQAYESETPQP